MNQPADDPFLHQKMLSGTEDVKIILDIGANQGQTARRYQQLFPQAAIYSFEPLKNCFAILTETFKNCPLVQPFQLAVRTPLAQSLSISPRTSRQ